MHNVNRSRRPVVWATFGLLSLAIAGTGTADAAPAPAHVARYAAAGTNRAARARTVLQLRRKAMREKKRVDALAAAGKWPAARAGRRANYEHIAIRDGRIYGYKIWNRDAAISTAADKVRQTAPFELDGAGVIVGVWDAGAVRASHAEFDSRVTVVDSVSVHNHSTHVAGTIAAAGVQAAAKGMAPLAEIHSYDWGNDVGEMLAAGADQPAQSNAIRVSNHSYGLICGWDDGYSPVRWYGAWGARESDYFGIYDGFAEDWDGVCYASPYFLPFKSAGNDRNDSAPAAGAQFSYFDDGQWQTKAYDPATDPLADGWDQGGFDTVSSVGAAKNVITVGAVADAVSGSQRYPANADMEAYSSWGPTDDGRIKPDIVANGGSLYSTFGGSDTQYGTYSGTSMATPNAAGSAALLVQQFEDLFPGRSLLSSSLKGLIIHTADDLGRPGPDYSFGWGLMNTLAAAEQVLMHSRFPAAQALVEGTVTNTDKQSVTFQWNEVEPIKVTLCWLDPPASAVTGLDNPSPRLVHNLDLRVIDPMGVTNYPFVLDPANPTNLAVMGENMLDNVEQVFIAAPATSGIYTVEIGCSSNLAFETQVYSLFVSGADAPPTIAHTPHENALATEPSYDIAADIMATSQPTTNAVMLHWNTNGVSGPFAAMVMTNETNYAYRAAIPAQPLGTRIYYYMEAVTRSGLSTREPAGAPTTLNSFDVAPAVTLMVAGTPGNYGVVDPGYGMHTIASGNVVAASAPLVALETNDQRHACAGWVGIGSVPGSGSSNSVVFSLERLSALEWQWSLQYSLVQTSTVAGVAVATTWWDAGSAAESVTAPSAALVDGTDYRFVEWRLDGIRQPDDTNTAINPVSGIVMDAGRTAAALYLPADLDDDGDGMGDWWELHHFGSDTVDPYDDADGDGYLNLEEYQDRSNPRDPFSVPAAPAVQHTPMVDPQGAPAPWLVSAVVTDNHEVAEVLIRWRRNGLAWRQGIMVASGASNLFSATIPAPGILNDTFEYEILATDNAGYLAAIGPYEFGVVYPIAGLTPDRLDVLLLHGAQTNCTLSLDNTGNTNLIWTAETVGVGFSDDMEAGGNAWTHNGQGDLWHLSTKRAASGLYSWYCGSELSGNYDNNMHTFLSSSPVLLASGATLSFMYWAATELDSVDYYTWDGGIVEISTDGTAYEAIAPVGGYPYKIVDNLASPFAPDTPCFGGTGGWQSATFDLSDYAGERVWFRFRFGSDGFIVEEGWYIDDVRVAPTTLTTNWLSLSPTNGVLPAPGATGIVARLDASTVQSGLDYVAMIRLLSNDPQAPERCVETRMSVRSIPTMELLSAVQTSTNGLGLVTISNRVSDADGAPCAMEVLFSADSGATWTSAWINAASAAFGAPAVSNGPDPAVQDVATASGGVPVTNEVDIVWDTQSSPAPPSLTTNAMVRCRVWDGIFWSAAVTSESFLVDNEPPGPVPDLVCTSHTTGVWSADTTVDLAWGPAADGDGIGVRGYSAVFTNSATSAPPAVVGTTNLTITGPSLSDGTNWWCTVHALDSYGNAGPDTNLGPYRIDATPPDASTATVSVLMAPYGDYVVGNVVTGAWYGFSDRSSGIAGYYYSWTNGGGTGDGAWTNGAGASISGPVPDSTNVLYVWARDNVGRIGSAAARPVLVLNPDTDYDGDGHTTAEEGITGSDAANPASVFEIEALTSVTNQFGQVLVVQWQSITGRIYTVYDVPSLAGSPPGWTALTNYPGTGGTMSHTSRIDALPMRFYRVGVERP